MYYDYDHDLDCDSDMLGFTYSVAFMHGIDLTNYCQLVFNITWTYISHLTC